MNEDWKRIGGWGRSLAARAGLAMSLLAGAGAVLLLIAIWWLGPQWIWREQQPLASVAHRSIASLLVLLVLLLGGLIMLRWRVGQLQAERQQQDAIEADPCLPWVLAQERVFNRRLAHYVDHAGGRRALYRLPWYLVLGEQNAGKTGFITRSAQFYSLTGISKTLARHHQDEALALPVDWWLSNEAVIIDPCGEFITQNAVSSSPPCADNQSSATPPQEAAARLWEHLLGWLARNRSRRALNGLVWVVDLAWLLRSTPEQRSASARLMRSRLFEVSRQSGSRLPLYVVLSKFDLLDGFDALFARMSASEREQMLGFTFRLDAARACDAWLDDMAHHYDRLIEVLQEQMLDGLSLLNDTEQRQRLVSLQAQLIGLRPVLMGFLREALTDDRFGTPVWVRGLYLSSVFQQGEMNNAFIRAAAQPYKVPPPLSDARPQGGKQVYFAQQLFHKVIYPEAGLAGDNVKVARSKRRLLWVSSGVGLLAFAVVGATWQRYFEINRAKAASVLVKSQAFSRREVDPRMDPTGRNLLAPLDRIGDAVSVFGDYRATWPLLADLGLYQGRAIGPRVDEAYLSLLSRRFLPALASGAVDAMNAAPEGSEQQMAALRVYRMIEDRQSRRGQWVQDWMARQWQAAYPGQGQVQSDLMRHLKYALAYADTDLPQFRQRVGEVQQVLRNVPLAQRVYASLKHQAQEQLPAGVDLRHHMGPAFDVVYRPAPDDTRSYDAVLLAPLLTARGFKQYFEPRSQQITDMAMIDQWAMGERLQADYSDADRLALTEQIRALYSADYIDSWRRALNAFAVTDFQDLRHGVSVLEHLTGPAAPLRRLLESVRDNTALYSAPQQGDALVTATGSSPDRQQAAGIHRAFASLHELLESRGQRASQYDETLGAISALHEYAKAVQDSPERGTSALNAVLERFSMKGPDPIVHLQRVAAGLPDPVRQQVRKVADQTARVLVIEALRELERRWDSEVYGFFQQRLAGRYPFVVRAPDASLDDFQAFFGPKGRLQQFQDRYLKVFLKDNLDALYADSRGGHLIRADVIEQLERADRIRESFFDHRGNLSVQFSVEPLGLSASHRTSVLDLDGQLVSYTHGPSQIAGVIWPNTLGPQVRSNLTLLRLNGNSSSLEYRGPWSMFRLLSRGALNGRTATSVDLSFRTGDGMMRYRMTSEKTFNPITRQPFKDFRLPRTLLESSRVGEVQDELAAGRTL